MKRDFKVGRHYWLTGWTSSQKLRVEIVSLGDGVANVIAHADRRNRGIRPDAIDGEIMTAQLALLGAEVKS